MRRRAAAAAFGVAVAVCAVGAAEIWQRGHELGSMQVDFDPPGIKYAIDPTQPDEGRGWREDRVPPPRRDGVFRMVCLGDSVTFGINVGARETWCEDVRRALPGGTAEAFNFGTNGYDAEQVATLLDARVAAWQPDVVVWGTYVNDVFPTYLLYGMRTGDPVFVGSDIPAQARLLPEGPSLWLVRHSALFRLLQGAAYARSERTVGPHAASPDLYGQQVDRMLAWSAREHVPVVFLAIPPHVMADMAKCPQEFPVQGLCAASLAQYRSITAALGQRGIAWVDGLAAFQASGQPNFHPQGRKDPDHPNAAGHAVLAAAVEPSVEAVLSAWRR